MTKMGRPLGSGIWTQLVGGKQVCKECQLPIRNKPACSIPYHESYYQKQLIANKIAHERQRIELIQKYGGKCSCCGYADIAKKILGKWFLQIDHIFGRHNDKYPKGQARMSSSKLYWWLKRSGYPNTFRVLCGACNNAIEPGQPKCELHKE